MFEIGGKAKGYDFIGTWDMLPAYADMMKAVCGIDLYRHPWLNQTARFPMYWKGQSVLFIAITEHRFLFMIP